MKNIKLLLLDLDDTLLNRDKKITERTRTALCKAHDVGIKIGYITARSPRSVKGLLRGLPIDAVSCYGGVKTSCNKVMVSRIDMPYKGGASIVTEIKNKKPNGYLSVYFEPYGLKQDGLYKDFKKCDEDWTVAITENGIQRIMIKTPDFSLIEKHITSDMLVVQTRHGEKIITHRDSDKGNAAKLIAEHYSIELEDSVVFGDDLSDFPMFRVCGTGVAMKNALYEIKSAANYITDSCDDDGIAKWIEKYILH